MLMQDTNKKSLLMEPVMENTQTPKFHLGVYNGSIETQRAYLMVFDVPKAGWLACSHLTDL